MICLAMPRKKFRCARGRWVCAAGAPGAAPTSPRALGAMPARLARGRAVDSRFRRLRAMGAVPAAFEARRAQRRRVAGHSGFSRRCEFRARWVRGRPVSFPVSHGPERAANGANEGRRRQRRARAGCPLFFDFARKAVKSRAEGGSAGQWLISSVIGGSDGTRRDEIGRAHV